MNIPTAALTVQELINILQRLDPDAIIVVRASCCRHAHPIYAVLDGEDADDYDVDVVLKADG